MGPFTLYQYGPSGNCYKVRLAASFLGQKLDIYDVDFFGGETKSADFKSKINATGQVPVLQVDSETYLPQSNAAIYYLADISKSELIPKDPLQHAQMLQWMFWEQYTHEPKIAVRRFLLFFVGEKNLNQTQRDKLGPLKEDGEKALGVMEEHLTKQDFFAANRLTLADIALYAYTHVAADGGFDMSKFPNVKAWCDRITRQQGYAALST